MAAKGHEVSGMKSNLRPVITGVISGLVVSIVMLLLFSVLITVQDTPQALIDPIAIFALSAGAFTAGLVCTRMTRGGGLVYGAVCGAILSVLVLAAGLAAGAGGIGVSGLFRVIFIMLCAMIGGVSGVNMRAKTRH